MIGRHKRNDEITLVLSDKGKRYTGKEERELPENVLARGEKIFGFEHPSEKEQEIVRGQLMRKYYFRCKKLWFGEILFTSLLMVAAIFGFNILYLYFRKALTIRFINRILLIYIFACIATFSIYYIREGKKLDKMVRKLNNREFRVKKVTFFAFAKNFLIFHISGTMYALDMNQQKWGFGYDQSRMPKEEETILLVDMGDGKYEYVRYGQDGTEGESRKEKTRKDHPNGCTQEENPTC